MPVILYLFSILFDAKSNMRSTGILKNAEGIPDIKIPIKLSCPIGTNNPTVKVINLMDDERGPKRGINKYIAVKIIHDVHKLNFTLFQNDVAIFFILNNKFIHPVF